MEEPKNSDSLKVREKQFLSKPTAKRSKLTEGQHKAKFDVSPRSKFLYCIPLNSASVRGITAVTFLICALEILLTLYSFSLTTQYDLATHTRSIIFCTFWFLIAITGSVLATSTFLCIRSSSTFFMQIWLILTGLTWFGQFLAAATITGAIWSEFERTRQEEPIESFKGISGAHILVFSLWWSIFLFAWIFAIYIWRVVFFYFSVEKEVLTKHSRIPKTISPRSIQPTRPKLEPEDHGHDVPEQSTQPTPLQPITSATRKPKPKTTRPKPEAPEQSTQPTVEETPLQPITSATRKPKQETTKPGAHERSTQPTVEETPLQPITSLTARPEPEISQPKQLKPDVPEASSWPTGTAQLPITSTPTRPKPETTKPKLEPARPKPETTEPKLEPARPKAEDPNRPSDPKEENKPPSGSKLKPIKPVQLPSLNSRDKENVSKATNNWFKKKESPPQKDNKPYSLPSLNSKDRENVSKAVDNWTKKNKSPQ